MCKSRIAKEFRPAPLIRPAERLICGGLNTAADLPVRRLPTRRHAGAFDWPTDRRIARDRICPAAPSAGDQHSQCQNRQDPTHGKLPSSMPLRPEFFGADVLLVAVCRKGGAGAIQEGGGGILCFQQINARQLA